MNKERYFVFDDQLAADRREKSQKIRNKKNLEIRIILPF